MRRLGLIGWSRAVIIPAIVTLTPPNTKFYERVPLIYILELPSFLSEFEVNLDSLTHLRLPLPRLKGEPAQTILRH